MTRCATLKPERSSSVHGRDATTALLQSLSTLGRTSDPIRRLSRLLLPGAFASQCRLNSLLLAWLQIESVPLDVLDDFLLQDFALEAAQRVLQRFAILDLNFSQ